MRYRAILAGVNPERLERPKQTLTNSLEDAREWAELIIRQHPDGRVEIWETVETKIAEVGK